SASEEDAALSVCDSLLCSADCVDVFSAPQLVISTSDASNAVSFICFFMIQIHLSFFMQHADSSSETSHS
ncbi:MAG TPA: hypothetical protein DCG49_09045, partial [Ruminococcus sp.]|nr:hypothetical protein [Ruminococcus sp.]